MKRDKTIKLADVATPLNLSVAHRMARQGKSFYNSVQRVDEKMDEYIAELHEILMSGRYHTSKYIHETVSDSGKIREISKLPYYPDRIVHWAIMLQMEPIFMKKFTRSTHAAIKGRGTHSALHETRGYLLADEEGTRYCLKIDVKKYFPHIQHDVLTKMIEGMISDADLIALISEIIESVPKDKGVPIGNYLSQYFANLYLSLFDHWLKETMRVKYTVRYMDDIIILGPNAHYLHSLFREIEWFLRSRLQLEIKPNWQVFRVDSRGIDYVGYRIYRNRVLVRKSTFARMRKRCATIYYHARVYGELTLSERCSLMSYCGILMHTTPKVGRDLFRRYIYPTIQVMDYKITKKMERFL